MIQRIHLRCGSFGSVIRFWILVKKRNILFRIENPDLDLIKEINASSMLMFMREWRRRWWWWLWWWCRGCHEQWGSIKTVLSHAYSTKKQRRVLHKQQNLIQDSLAQNWQKNCCPSAKQARFKRYQSPFLFSKQATNLFFRNSQESQRKQIWTRENSCASPLLQYVTFAVSYFACFGVAKNTPANSSDRQFILFHPTVLLVY